ncbi:hypothetical protein PIB30_000128 [Stylosanthes scabra]|uniref:Uncharacterized protein n=1 Tax=Stylosanthes scabra TaxID=79078 RepID=A0ABU6R312_9FABA|nr:hypothetical protein [Stylosanthes scabra]
MELVETAIRKQDKFLKAQTMDASNLKPSAPGKNSPESWKPPPTQLVKLNVDTSIFNGEAVGIGVVTGDSFGCILMTCTWKEPHPIPIHVTEAHACYVGLQKANECCFLDVIIERISNGDDGRIVDCALVKCGDPSYIRIKQDQYVENKEVHVEIANFCPVPIIDLRVKCGSFIKSRVQFNTPDALKHIGINGQLVDCDLVECKEEYIKIRQYPEVGSQEISVAIINTCVRIAVVDVRVDCGSFLRSGVPLPTDILKPLGGNQCLLNNGDVLGYFRTYFEYSYPQILPLNVTSIKCLRPPPLN